MIYKACFQGFKFKFNFSKGRVISSELLPADEKSEFTPIESKITDTEVNDIYKKLRRYFLKGGDELRKVELDFGGATKFQKKVYLAVRKIQRGEVRTYAQIAASVGSRNSYRAVGTALSKNKHLLFIP